MLRLHFFVLLAATSCGTPPSSAGVGAPPSATRPPLAPSAQVDAASAVPVAAPTTSADASPPATVTPALPAGAAPLCTRSFPDDAALRSAKEGTSITIPAYFAAAPAAGRFTLEGFVQTPSHCGPCAPGAHCKPCEDSIFLSEARAAYKHPIADGVDFRIVVPDASRFELLGRYRVTVEVCRKTGTSPELPTRELRGYRRIPDP